MTSPSDVVFPLSWWPTVRRGIVDESLEVPALPAGWTGVIERVDVAVPAPPTALRGQVRAASRLTLSLELGGAAYLQVPAGAGSVGLGRIPLRWPAGVPLRLALKSDGARVGPRRIFRVMVVLRGHIERD